MPRTVVFGYGNPSRGDDALGPHLLNHLVQAGLPGVEPIEAFQLQIEHALDLVGADLALFLDAGAGTPAPFTFEEVHPGGVFTASTHALSPSAVLSVHRQLQASAPPPAFVLCVRGESFGLGEGLSPQAAQHLALAQIFVRGLCAQPDVMAWRTRVGVARC